MEIGAGRSGHVRLMARYNESMNVKLYAAASGLSAEQLSADRKAFFGSILGTLNHLLVADIAWLKRFAAHPAHYGALDPIRVQPAPTRLDQPMAADLQGLRTQRVALDRMIVDWAGALAEADLDHALAYQNMAGVAARKNFFGLLMHFFNHQTHHRGQATTLLAQVGVDVGVTDLAPLIPNEDL